MTSKEISSKQILSLICLVYKSFYKAIIESIVYSPIEKGAKDIKRQTTEKDMEMVNKHMKRCVITLIIKICTTITPPYGRLVSKQFPNNGCTNTSHSTCPVTM